MSFNEYLQFMVKHEASDLYLSTGAEPSIRVHGEIKNISNAKLQKDEVKAMTEVFLSAEQKKEFNLHHQLDLALSYPNIGRFRVNVFQQQGQVSLVARHVKTQIPDLKSLFLPNMLTSLVMEKRGLVLFVGGTGTGKSTSLAALINYRNENTSGHIITIEDPIEFIHEHKKSIINQREIGMDTDSYDAALRNTLRQAPDVILIGEIRTQEAMQYAIAFSETGHLCLSTLHANNANQALDRIINFFPEDKRSQLLLDLSFNLKAIVSQRLIPTVNGNRRAIFEILLGTPFIKDLIRRGEIHKIKDAMEQSKSQGMRTFDDELYQLYQGGEITLEEAIRNADSKNNVKVRIAMEEGVQAPESLSFKEEADNTIFGELGGRGFVATEEIPEIPKFEPRSSAKNK